MTKSNNNSVDITFIGAGISTAYTLISFIEKLSNLNNNSKIVKINVIDKYPEFFYGIPYGERSGNTVLLINSLRNFLPEKERKIFINWLKKNKDILINEFLALGGKQSNRWYENNQKDINQGQWEELFIPRYFFGKYIVEKVKQSIADAIKEAFIEINFITAEVIDLTKEDGKFNLKLGNNTTLCSNKVVLSVGSMPTKKVFTEKLNFEDTNFLMINDIYNKTLDINFKKIENFIKKRKSQVTNVLIIGANASALESIYKINNQEDLNNSVTKYYVLSTHGLMPDSEINHQLNNTYIPKNLENLKSSSSLTAKQIADAVYLDLDIAEDLNLGAASTVDIISNAFGNLLNKLNEEELEIFACKHGNEIGRRQRCAGIHYTSVVDNLRNENKIIHKAGRFLNISKENDSTYKVSYTDTKTKELRFFTNIHLVINCIGSINLESDKVPKVIKSLIENGICIPNDSKIGFKVNKRFETKENFHVAGPLLAGNVINERPLWHLEHCARIIWSSNLLGECLI